MALNKEQALDCFASDDLIGIGMEADAVRHSLHPEGVVTYAVEHRMTAVQANFSVYSEMGEVVQSGGTSFHLASDPSSPLTLGQFCDLLLGIRNAFPSLRVHGLSADEVCGLSTTAGLSLEETLIRLRAAGLDAIGGDGRHGLNCDAAQGELERWLDVHRAAHRAGLRSTAGLVFGGGESSVQRTDRLMAIRDLQSETGSFTSFTPSSFRPATPADPREEPTAVEYLRTLAIARILFDNIDNIESSCTAQGLKVAQMALRFGANDAGSLPGKLLDFTEEDLRRVIRDAGFTPVERDAGYRTMFLNN